MAVLPLKAVEPLAQVMAALPSSKVTVSELGIEPDPLTVETVAV